VLLPASTTTATSGFLPGHATLMRTTELSQSAVPSQTNHSGEI
jgi:hypothetical protein